MEKVIIGKIIKPHGYKGAMKVKDETRGDVDFANISSVFIDNKLYNIQDNFFAGGDIVLKLEGIESSIQVDALRKKSIEIGKEEYLSEKEEDDVLISDLIGANIVLNDGELIGELLSVENYGASDLFFIKSNKYTNLIVPNVKGLIELYNSKNKELMFNKIRFFEVMTCDEN